MTSPMTPGQAREAIDAAEGTTDYTWVDAHHALETIAGMQEEWGVVGQISPTPEWFPTKDAAVRFMGKVLPASPRLVRRYVTQHEVIDGE